MRKKTYLNPFYLEISEKNFFFIDKTEWSSTIFVEQEPERNAAQSPTAPSLMSNISG
jgi:hypothetical protein